MGNSVEDKKEKLHDIIIKISPVRIINYSASVFESSINELGGVKTSCVDITVKKQFYETKENEKQPPIMYRAFFNGGKVFVQTYDVSYMRPEDPKEEPKRVLTPTDLRKIPKSSDEHTMKIIKEIAIRAGYKQIYRKHESEQISDQYIKPEDIKVKVKPIAFEHNHEIINISPYANLKRKFFDAEKSIRGAFLKKRKN